MDIRVGSGAEDRAMHYAVCAQSVRNLGTPVFPRALFEAVLDAFGEDADILTVLADGQPVASVLSLYHRGAVMPWLGAESRRAALRANDVMYYALMCHARRRGCDRFDFGRSKTDTAAPIISSGTGGSCPTRLPMRIGRPTVRLRATSTAQPQISGGCRLWQKLPLPIANVLWPFIANGLA
jgi:hypothetical protein